MTAEHPVANRVASDAPAVIVGAGPAGMTAVAALLARGVRTRRECGA